MLSPSCISPERLMPAHDPYCPIRLVGCKSLAGDSAFAPAQTRADPVHHFLSQLHTRMKKTFRYSLAVLALAVSGIGCAQTLLNASYDVAREFYKDYNSAFIAHYKKTVGKDVKVDQAHAGSSAQARAVNDGLDADVVTMNTTTDIDFLAGTGVVAKDFAKRFPNNASPTSSTMLFLTRNGNPKNIKDWDDLIKPGVQVIVVNPKTGGNGRLAYLAAWGSVRKKGGTDAQAAEFIGKLYISSIDIAMPATGPQLPQLHLGPTVRSGPFYAAPFSSKKNSGLPMQDVQKS